MFNSLLGAVSVDSLILDIFIILAVVVACALVVYFLWEGISAMVNKDKKSSKELDLGKKKDKKDVLVLDYSLDKKEEPVEQKLIDETKITEVDEAKAEEEKAEVEAQVSDEERANAERRAYLEARRQELIRRMQAEMEEEKEEESEEEVEEPVAEETVDTEEVVEETTEPVASEAEEVVSEEVESDIVEEEQIDTLAEEREALAAEKARYEAMVKELDAAKKALAEQKQETVTVEVPVVVPTNGVLSLDELKARLAAAEAKLAATEKEFRACKKEYSPLHRVWTTHERDEKKLRRKEALVAKQKVVLYGVNNYADIDEEKAKKLAEDLDLLDGLKLSVQHCEEVMKKNAERYPLLERMYNVLNARNEELKSDIAYYKAEIAKLEEEQENA